MKETNKTCGNCAHTGNKSKCNCENSDVEFVCYKFHGGRWFKSIFDNLPEGYHCKYWEPIEVIEDWPLVPWVADCPEFGVKFGVFNFD